MPVHVGSSRGISRSCVLGSLQAAVAKRPMSEKTQNKRMLRTAAKALDAACARAEAMDPVTEESVAGVEAALAAAEAQGCDVLMLNPARRRLRELESRAHAARAGAANTKLAPVLAAIEAAAQEGAVSLLQHVYRVHPPKSASLSADVLAGLPSESGGKLKKALLKAQRDYHPDRNQDMVRDTLGYDPEEWEVLSANICQHLSGAYDSGFKGEREYGVDDR